MDQIPRDRRARPLSDEQLEQLAEVLAEKVAQKAYDKFASYVGRSILNRFWLIALAIGAGIAAAWKIYQGK